jgi:hypothetical protein
MLQGFVIFNAWPCGHHTAERQPDRNDNALMMLPFAFALFGRCMLGEAEKVWLVAMEERYSSRVR